MSGNLKALFISAQILGDLFPEIGDLRGDIGRGTGHILPCIYIICRFIVIVLHKNSFFSLFYTRQWQKNQDKIRAFWVPNRFDCAKAAGLLRGKNGYNGYNNKDISFTMEKVL